MYICIYVYVYMYMYICIICICICICLYVYVYIDCYYPYFFYPHYELKISEFTTWECDVCDG